MAGKGTYAAYAPAKAGGEDFSNNLRNAEYMGFRYRAEEQRARDKRNTRIAEQAKILGTTIEEITIPETGIKDVDAPAYDYVLRASNKLTELSKRIAENPEDIEAQILYQKYENSAKHLKGFVEKFQAYQLDYKKGIAEGRYSKTLNAGIPEKISQGLQNGNYKIINDKNGDLQLFVDLDGDGKNDEDFASVNVREFLAGNNLYAPKQAYDPYAIQDKIAGRFGTVDVTTDEEGYVTRKYKGFDPKKTDQLKQEVNATLGTHDNMTDVAKSILGDKLGFNPDKVTEKQFKEFKDDFSQDIINTFNKTESTEDDYARRNSDNSNARAQGRYNQEMKEKREKENQQEESKEFIEQATDENDNPITETVAGVQGNVLTFPQGKAPEVNGRTAERMEIYDDGSLGLVFTEKKTENDVDKNTGEAIKRTVYEEKVERDKTKLNQAFRGQVNPDTGEEFKNLTEVYQHAKQRTYSKELEGLEDITEEEIKNL